MDLNSPPGPGVEPAYGGVPARRGRGALWIAGLGLLLLIAAAFVLSYDGLYATALAGGVRPSLAFLYPMIFDGFLVVAFAAALVLRPAGLRTTWYPWTLIVVLLLAAAGANVLHALGRESLLPPDSTKVIVAAVPPAAVGLAFPLWLVMFIHVRGGRRTRSGDGGTAVPSTGTSSPTDVGKREEAPVGLRHEDGEQRPAAERRTTADGRATKVGDAEPPAGAMNSHIHADAAVRADAVDRPGAETADDIDAADAADEMGAADEQAGEDAGQLRTETPTGLANRVAAPSSSPSATPPSGKVRSSPTPPDS